MEPSEYQHKLQQAAGHQAGKCGAKRKEDEEDECVGNIRSGTSDEASSHHLPKRTLGVSRVCMGRLSLIIRQAANSTTSLAARGCPQPRPRPWPSTPRRRCPLLLGSFLSLLAQDEVQGLPAQWSSTAAPLQQYRGGQPGPPLSQDPCRSWNRMEVTA